MTGSIMREIEEQIIRRLVQDSMDAGYRIGVDDGCQEGKLVLEPTTKVDEVMAALFSVDEEHLIYIDEEGKRVSWVFLVHGNSGWDVISDHGTRLEHVMKGADELIEKFSK